MSIINDYLVQKSKEFLIPKDESSVSPSEKDGIGRDTEKNYLIFGCELIHELVILMRLRGPVLVTAQALLHRFYSRCSLKRFDVHIVAMTCIFLAGKVEGFMHKLSDLINVCYFTMLRRLGRAVSTSFVPNDVSLFRLLVSFNTHVFKSLFPFQVESEWKFQILRTERFVLKELGFQMFPLSKENPHSLVLYFVKALGGDDILAQRSWNYCNDSMRLGLTLRYPIEAIATSCVSLAADDIGFPLPTTVPWYEVFNTSKEDLEIVMQQITSLYELPKFTWLSSLRDK